ncbi:MAG: NAD(P)/FAD-dependent oxidoreductase [Thermoleophilia bacterium]
MGAGPAGVGAAQRAARAGHRVVLLERAGRVGGAAGSITVAGIRADLGSHRLHPTIEPRILAELRRLLGDDLQWRPRHGRIRLAGRWIAFPLRPGDLLRRMPPAMALGIARDTALGPLRRPRADTFAEVLRAALGPTICDRFYFPYARKIWGLPPELLAGEQARRRVGASSPGRILRRVLSKPDAARRGFLSPRRGYGQLWEALAADAAAAGARVELGAEVTGVDLTADGARVTMAGGGEVTGRRVWSTIPLTALAAIARPAPDAAALAAAGTLRFRAMLLVYLVLEGGRYSPFDAHYLPEPHTPVTRVSEPPNYRDGDDPPGRTLLCAEIPCDAGDALWGASDDALARLAADGLAASGLPRPVPAGVHVERLAHAYPVLRAGYAGDLARLEAWAAAQPALLTLGRQGLFVHDNAHHALAMAWAAVDCLGPDGGFDQGAWRATRARFARHVVED